MSTFAELKKNRRRNVEKLAEKTTKSMKGGGFEEDTRFWKPRRDKAGNATAIIRFLPAPAGENDPWSEYYDHAFQGPGGWYFEKSLTSIGGTDPVSEYNSMLWNSGEEGKKQASAQRRRRNFVSNVYVIDDKNDPANNGRVFLYRYGKQIFEKINEQLNPSFEGDDPVDPFDLWEGANFRLRVYTDKNFPKYDKCHFDTTGALSEDEDELERIWKEAYPLEPFAKEGFKGYDELKTKLQRTLGLTSLELVPRDRGPKKPDPEEESRDEESIRKDSEFLSTGRKETADASPDQPPKESAKEDETPFDTKDDEDDEDMKFFRSLRNG